MKTTYILSRMNYYETRYLCSGFFKKWRNWLLYARITLNRLSDSIMKKKPLNSLFKHLDFIVIDFICLQIAFFLGHWIRFGIYNPLLKPKYLFEDVVFVAAQLVVVLFSTN